MKYTIVYKKNDAVIIIKRLSPKKIMKDIINKKINISSIIHIGDNYADTINKTTIEISKPQKETRSDNQQSDESKTCKTCRFFQRYDFPYHRYGTCMSSHINAQTAPQSYTDDWICSNWKNNEQ
jgi:hypothetical protein